VSGCSPNQGKFYPQFDHIVLLTAPAAVIVERLANRTTNPYGKHPDEVARVLYLQQTVQPLLRRGAGLRWTPALPSTKSSPPSSSSCSYHQHLSCSEH
jgi:hypothetical protein